MMKSAGLLLILTLPGVLAVLAADWSILLPPGPICAVIGSSVVLPCSYNYPQSSEQGGASAEHYSVSSEIWCRDDSRCIAQRYVFHSAGISLDPSFQNRVTYLGQTGSKNCSLRLSDLRPSDSGSYVFYLITNHTTQKMPKQRGVQLLVADSPAAVAVTATPSGDITEGVALRLACCSPAAGPGTRFAWFRVPGVPPVLGSDGPVEGPVWTMDGVGSQDSGRFFCEIQDGDGAWRRSETLSVHVHYPPRNTSLSASMETLTCSTDADPPVLRFDWYSGAACLLADKSEHAARKMAAAATGGGGVRTLSSSSISISDDESGQHCCVARNPHGSQTVSWPVGGWSTGITTAIIAVCVFVIVVTTAGLLFYCLRRRQKSSHQRTSYSRAATTAPDPSGL